MMMMMRDLGGRDDEGDDDFFPKTDSFQLRVSLDEDTLLCNC